MAQVRVKICGLTRVENAIAVAATGVDAIGLVFYKKSARYVDIAEAEKIAKAVGPFTTVTALFVNPTVDEVEQVLSRVPIHLIQFHGDESPEFCAQFNRPFIKAFRVRENVALEPLLARYDNACGWLLDAYVEDEYGGTGMSFDWSSIPNAIMKKIVLAGGLTPENVGKAVSHFEPLAVDVSGGVEQVKGIKCLLKVQAFVDAINAAQ